MSPKAFVVSLALALLVSLLILRLFAPDLVVHKPLGMGLEIVACGLLAITLAVIAGLNFEPPRRKRSDLFWVISLMLPYNRISRGPDGPGVYFSLIGGFWLAGVVDVAYRMDGLLSQRSPTVAAIAAVLMVVTLLVGWKFARDRTEERDAGG